MAGKTRKIVRDAGTGRFLPRSAAKRRPKTTVTETVKSNRARRK